MLKTLVFLALLLPLAADGIAQSACDLDGSGGLDNSDVIMAQAMALGTTPCNTSLAGTPCNAILVQKIIFASSPGGFCLDESDGMTGTTSVPLAWDASISENISGYKVYGGLLSGSYGLPITIGNQTAYTVVGLPLGLTWFFAVTAFDTDGNESDFSNEVSKLPYGPGIASYGSLALSTKIVGYKGTTVVVPLMIAANTQADELASSVQYTIMLPSLFKTATVSAGPASTSAGKNLSCKTILSGPNVGFKCLHSGGTTPINAGILAYVRIPLPTNISGSINVGIGGQVMTTAVADPITTTVTAGKVTIK